MMARIRSIKPEFWEDELVASWPMATRLAYIGLWNEADDEGRLRASPAFLRSRLFPYDLDLDMAEALQPLIDSGRLVVYQVDGQTYGWIPKFRQHQVINRPAKSRLPPQPELTDHQARLTEDSLSPHGVVTDDSQQEGKGREQGTGKGKEGNAREESAPLEAVASPPSSKGPDPEILRETWNATADPRLPRWREMTPKRKAAARARLRERPMDGPDGWREVITRISASPFCRGENDRGWKASPDFLLQPDTATKVLEGKYDGRSGDPYSDDSLMRKYEGL